VWNNLHITADIIFRPTMTHVVISLRGQLDIQRQALRHDKSFQFIHRIAYGPVRLLNMDIRILLLFAYHDAVLTLLV
jgi:hypothetical protein